MLRRSFRRVSRDNAGTAAIEFGLVAPFLVALVVGTVELGTGAREAMQAQNAAEAGAVYAPKNGFDVTGISNAVVNSAGSARIAASPAPSLFCGCPAASGITTAACDSTCAGGATPAQYVQISALIMHTPMLSFSGLVMPDSFSGTAIVRIY